jgi:hypothetical protein
MRGQWLKEEFTGTGFPGDFYIKYHLYRHYWPLMALGRYRGESAALVPAGPAFHDSSVLNTPNHYSLVTNLPIHEREAEEPPSQPAWPSDTHYYLVSFGNQIVDFRLIFGGLSGISDILLETLSVRRVGTGVVIDEVAGENRVDRVDVALVPDCVVEAAN